MDPDRVEAIVAGFARGCSEFGCPLLGGETAEMPGTYAPGDYDLAGFIVGVVERERALTGAAVQAGDTLVGLPSAGLHTNGYTLARKVLFETLGHQVSTRLPELGQTLGEALLAPHRSYLAALEPLLERKKIRALAHITGGGFAGNIPRVLPAGPRRAHPPRAPGRCRPCSASSRKAAPSPTTRCCAPSTWAWA